MKSLRNSIRFHKQNLCENSVFADQKRRGTLNSKIENIIIRKATSEDAAEIANVHISSWREAYRGMLPQEYLDQLPLSFRERMNLWRKISADDDKALFVAEAPQGIIGFAGYSHPREESMKSYGELGAIYLLEKHQGKGIGFDLLKVGMQKLMEWNYSKAYCWVMKTSPTIKFYQKTGATLSGVEQDDEIFGVTTRDVICAWENLEQFK